MSRPRPAAGGHNSGDTGDTGGGKSSGAGDGPTGPGSDGSGRMFDGIAGRYDLLNRLMSLGLDAGWRRQLVAALALPAGGRACDLACGTGDVALAIVSRHRDCKVVGLDASSAMLAVAAEKARAGSAAADIAWVHGDAQALPFEDASFDACAMAFGIRNIPDRLAALREMARICRPGRPVVVLELAQPERGWLGTLARLHVHHVAPWLGSLLSGDSEYRYLSRSIAAFPPPNLFCALMREAGLVDVAARRLSFGALHLYRGHVAR